MSEAHLIVTTRELSEPVELLAYADSRDPLVWLRSERGAVGVGEALRLESSGPSRFEDLNRRWRAICGRAEITDRVQLPGSGLVAFGAITFAANSRAKSVLTVPRFTLQRHDDRWFLTRVRTAAEPAHAFERESGFISPAQLSDFGLSPRDLAGSWQPATPLAGGSVGPAPGGFGTGSGAGAGGDVPGSPADESSKYFQSASHLLELLNTREISKIVLARRQRHTIPADADLRIPVSRLADSYRDCWTFSVDGLIGASPETLIRVIAGNASARVLAGTASRGADPQADAAARSLLETSPLITEEHRFAAQSVIAALDPLVENLQTGPDPLVIALPNVWHRATDITAQVSNSISSLDLVAAMHPTAAVAGTPTAQAVALIAASEGFDRERYAGAVGWIDAAGDGEWALALRCAQVSAVPAAVDPATSAVATSTATSAAATPGSASAAGQGVRRVTAWAGGGLVAGADLAGEFTETVIKFRPIRDAFDRPL